MSESLRFTDAEKASFRSVYCPTATDEQFNLFIQECERRQLMPGKDVVFQLRTASEWNGELRQKTFVKKVILITTIGALRLIAERCGRYEGRGPFIFYYGGENGELRESKIPLGKIPHAVSVEGYRKDWKHPLFATARYDAYVQMQGKDDDRKPTLMWSTRGEEQLAKCAEAAMLRTVAPEECSGLMVAEEMNDIISKEDAPLDTLKNLAGHCVTEIPLPTIAPIVNQKANATVDPMPVTLGQPLVASLVPEPQQERIQTTLIPLVTVPLIPLVPVVSTVAPEVSTPLPPVSATVETTQKSETDKPSTQKEVAEFLARAAKIVRDKLPKAGLKDQEASSAVKNYILKQSGKPTFRVIPPAVFDKLLKVLEDAATPEEAAAIAKAGSK